MRATYMNLVHFLHVGHWYSEGAAHFEEIRMWPNSDEYYANTTRAFRAADGTAYELCDCHRTSRGGHTENRYYRDVRRGISVSYVANLQHVIAGRDPLSLSPAGCIQPAHLTGARCCNAQQARCQPGRCEKETLDWKDQFSAPSASLNGTLALFGGPGSIDSIVFNVGLWGCLDKTYGASYAAGA